jgi:hypothetical protein
MFGKKITSILLAGALAVLALLLTVGPAAGRSDAGPRSFHGTVAAIAKNDSALTIRRRSGERTRFDVRASTVYEHVSGLGDLSKGTPVEVRAIRKGDRWVAIRIEANPGGDRPAGSDNPPGDNGGAVRGSDDPPGDDRGSAGHGADDSPGDDLGSGGHGSDD